MAVCIQTVELVKRYGSTLAVDHLNLEVQGGEVLGLLGPNGAGKSTTIGMLAGLIRPTSGSISIFGKDMRRHFLEIMSRLGVVCERPAFYGHLSARENLVILARLARREVTVDKALDRVGLLQVASKKVQTLSMGMRQRLGLAQALLLEPELLILDEPANGLDPEATQEMLGLLRHLANEAFVTIIFSSHMLHEVEELCDRVAIINKGRLIVCDRTDALLSYDQTHAEVLIDAAEAAAKRLVDMAWVVSVEARPGRLDVVLRDANIHQLNSFLLNTGYRVAGIMPRRRTLQDYFLKVLNS
ncbi:MAG: ABC transporter ATP-binding protein [Candidatus Hydrogenedentes bacterium]|nr:ABC transporter ATP-binding protein [Candidatus Hydrogenedentota bacterium]